MSAGIPRLTPAGYAIERGSFAIVKSVIVKSKIVKLAVRRVLEIFRFSMTDFQFSRFPQTAVELGAGAPGSRGSRRGLGAPLRGEACAEGTIGIRCAHSVPMPDDDDAIAEYDRAGSNARDAFATVRWPDLALDRANLGRLAEGVLAARYDLARLAFGEEWDGAAAGERVEEAWRTDALHARYAPEGMFVRAALSIIVTVHPTDDARAPDAPEDAPLAEEVLHFAFELCVSFTYRHHTRPFVDFMGGELRRESDDSQVRLDPFAHEVAPADAVAWGLNGVD